VRSVFVQTRQNRRPASAASLTSSGPRITEVNEWGEEEEVRTPLTELGHGSRRASLITIGCSLMLSHIRM
jgi:hypothetical protein